MRIKRGLDNRRCSKCGSDTSRYDKTDRCYIWRKSRITDKWLCNSCGLEEYHMSEKAPFFFDCLAFRRNNGVGDIHLNEDTTSLLTQIRKWARL